jgi:hypothetical protein
MNYKTSNGDDYDHYPPRYQWCTCLLTPADMWLIHRTNQLISSIIRSLDDPYLERRLCWRDEKAWKALEAGYEEIKRGE